jgi:hypothetical protein
MEARFREERASCAVLDHPERNLMSKADKLKTGEDENGHYVACNLDHFGNVVTDKTPETLRCGFVSTMWPTAKGAQKRGSEHLAEHEGEEPVALSETGADRGLEK